MESKKQEAEDFQVLLSKLTNEDFGVESPLFKNTYQVFPCGNLFNCPKPLGDIFRKSIVVCGTKGVPLKHDSQDNSESELEVTGSPLECVFDSSLLGQNSPKIFRDMLKSSSMGSTYRPVSVNTARYLIQLCNISKTINELPLLVLCDSKDPQQTVLMGISRKHKNTRLMLTSKGPYSKNEDLPDFQTIKAEHHKCFNSTFENSAFVHYDVLENPVALLSRGLLKPCKAGSLAVECTWNNASSALQLPTADAICELLVQSVTGDDFSGACSRYQEIRLIQALSQCIQSKDMVWPYTHNGGKLSENLRSLMNELGNADSRQKSPSIETPSKVVDFDKVFESAVLGKRTDFDFTDKLWVVLTECSSYEDLAGSLETVFKELKGTTTPPFICRDNVSTIGKLARNVNKRLVTYPSLENKLPMKLMLEIGIEKLQKDYVQLFSGLELAHMDSLMPYLKHDKLSKETVHCLEKLHAILELTIICWNYLKLSKLTLNSIVRSALKHYTTVPFVDTSEVLRFPTSMLHVKKALERHQPSEWQVSFLSKCNGYKKQTVLHLTDKPFFEYDFALKVPDSPTCSDGKSYYCTTATLIEDEFRIK